MSNKKQKFSPKNKKDLGMACHIPPLKKGKKQGEMPLPSLGPIPLKNVEFRDVKRRHFEQHTRSRFRVLYEKEEARKKKMTNSDFFGSLFTALAYSTVCSRVFL